MKLQKISALLLVAVGILGHSFFSQSTNAQGKSSEKKEVKNKFEVSGDDFQKPKRKSANEMTLHDFMEDYTKPATKLLEKTNEDKYLKAILQEIPNLAIDEEKEEWAKIVNEHLASGDLTASCKACHSLYKKEYKKTYKKRLIVAPDSLEGYPEEIKKAMKK